MRTLSIRQPYAELIFGGRGIKKVEYRSRPTKIIGERFYIYASKGKALGNGHWASGVVPPVPSAECLMPDLPRGVIVGTAMISRCVRDNDLGGYEWHLADVKRIDRPRRPKRQPQPVWFRPF